MKFSSFSLFALSGLFVGAFAAPATPTPSVAIPDPDLPVSARGDVASPEGYGSGEKTIEILTTLLQDVKTHTGSINSTMPASYAAEQKPEIIEKVQAEVKQIVKIISIAITGITELEVVQLVESDLHSIVELLAELIEEIVYTLKGVVEFLGITVAELLGSILPLLIHIIISLLYVVMSCVGDILSLLKGVLAPVLYTVGGILVELGFLLKGW